MAHREEIDDCIQLCKECADACRDCAKTLEDTDPGNGVIALCEKGEQLCDEAVVDLQLDGADAWETCVECAVRCDICAQACDKVDIEACRICATICRACAQQCRQTATLLQQEADKKARH